MQQKTKKIEKSYEKVLTLKKCCDSIKLRKRNERRNKMFRIEKFKAALVENGLTVADVAVAMGISKQALYRKMNGESDFYREEIQVFRKLINRDNVDDIFFAE